MRVPRLQKLPALAGCGQGVPSPAHCQMNNWYYIHYPNPKKPKLLLLHGLTSDAHIYRPIINLLRKDFEILVPGLPGLGETVSQNIKNITELSEKLNDFINFRKFVPSVVFGTSLGGTLVLFLAKSNPELFSRIIVHDPPWRKQSIHMGLFQQFEMLLAYSILLNPNLLKNKKFINKLLDIACMIKSDFKDILKKHKSSVIRILRETDIKTTLNIVRDLQKNDFSEIFKQIDSPIIILCSGNDKVVFPNETKLLSSMIKGSKLIMLENSDHDAVIDIPEKISEIILSS